MTEPCEDHEGNYPSVGVFEVWPTKSTGYYRRLCQECVDDLTNFVYKIRKAQ